MLVAQFVGSGGPANTVLQPPLLGKPLEGASASVFPVGKLDLGGNLTRTV